MLAVSRSNRTWQNLSTLLPRSASPFHADPARFTVIETRTLQHKRNLQNQSNVSL